MGAERGAAAVEFALVAMLLVTLLMGIMEFGYAFFVQGNIAGAAREAARVYAIGGNAAEGKQAAVKAGKAIDLKEDMVTYVTTCPGDSATVEIIYPYGGLTGGFFPFLPDTLQGTGNMRCNG